MTRAIVVKKLFIILILSIELMGCVGPKGFSMLTHYGNVPYVVNHECVSRTLNTLTGVTHFSIQETRRKYNNIIFNDYSYTYFFKDGRYPKIITISVKNNASTTISHSVQTPESYLWSSGDINKLSVDQKIMFQVEKKIVEVCALPNHRNFFKLKS